MIRFNDVVLQILNESEVAELIKKYVDVTVEEIFLTTTGSREKKAENQQLLADLKAQLEKNNIDPSSSEFKNEIKRRVKEVFRNDSTFQDLVARYATKELEKEKEEAVKVSTPEAYNRRVAKLLKLQQALGEIRNEAREHGYPEYIFVPAVQNKKRKLKKAEADGGTPGGGGGGGGGGGKDDDDKDEPSDGGKPSKPNAKNIVVPASYFVYTLNNALEFSPRAAKEVQHLFSSVPIDPVAEPKLFKETSTILQKIHLKLKQLYGITWKSKEGMLLAEFKAFHSHVFVEIAKHLSRTTYSALDNYKHLLPLIDFIGYYKDCVSEKTAGGDPSGLVLKRAVPDFLTPYLTNLESIGQYSSGIQLDPLEDYTPISTYAKTLHRSWTGRNQDFHAQQVLEQLQNVSIEKALYAILHLKTGEEAELNVTNPPNPSQEVINLISNPYKVSTIPDKIRQQYPSLHVSDLIAVTAHAKALLQSELRKSGVEETLPQDKLVELYNQLIENNLTLSKK